MAAFKVFDKDHSGTIDAEELAAILMRPGCAAPLTDAQARRVISQFE